VKNLLIFFLSLAYAPFLFSQAGFHFRLNQEIKCLDRLEIESGHLNQVHRDFNDQAIGFMRSDLLTGDSLAPLSKHNLNLILSNYPEINYYWGIAEKSNSDKTILNSFHKDKHLFSSFGEDHFLTIDPLFEMKMGFSNEHVNRIPFVNRRGIRIHAGIGKKFQIYTQVVESQFVPPAYLEEYIQLYKTFPGSSFLKDYNPKFYKDLKGYDFLLAQGAIRYEANKYLSLSLGHGNHKLGEGIRSLFLSDFAAPRFYLQMNLSVGKLNYQSLFYEMSAESRYRNGVDRLLPKKYMASHYFSLNLTNKWSIGIFESVIFNRDNGFELNYLNPFILYRFVEQALGSPDNALLGLKTSYLIGKKSKVYSQFLLDELVVGKLFSESGGWWGNKYAFQIGMKTINFIGVEDLDLQVEFNMVRPYTYSYSDSLSNYAHQQQSLAHPLGSNFREVLLNWSYHPNTLWSFEWTSMFAIKGLDTDGLNFGGNILRNNSSRIMDQGNFTTQGLRDQILFSSLFVTRKIWSKCWIDLDVFWRKKFGHQSNSSVWAQLGIRLNLERESRNLFF